MQKLLKRSRLAKSQLKKKVHTLDARILRRDRRIFIDQSSRHFREKLDAVKHERRRRRDDQDLGSLAPWHEITSSRATHIANGVNNNWGSFTSDQPRTVPRPRSAGLQEDSLAIREGDRVCVMQGRDGVKGRIGIVQSIDLEGHSAVVRGVNKIDVQVPQAHLQQSSSDTIQTSEASIPYHALRLLFPVIGQSRIPVGRSVNLQDALLSNISLRHSKMWEYLPKHEESAAISYQRIKANKSFVDGKREPKLDRRHGPIYRYLMPQNVRIPWPTPAESISRDEKRDTSQTLVEERTFLPTLLRPPMPEVAIDELRHKYSAFRVRHDEHFVALKEADALVLARERLLAKDLAVLSARNVARRVAADARSHDIVNGEKEHLLDLLGGHIAVKRARMAR